MIAGLITIFLLLGGIGSCNKGYSNADEDYNNCVVNHIYQKDLTYVVGIFADKLETKDGTFYINENSKFKDVESLELNQPIEVIYVEHYFNGKTLIDVNINIK
jgi:hypothetical protein